MAVPSRPQHLAKPKPRRSDTGKKINLRASAKSADKKQGRFSNREWTPMDTNIPWKISSRKNNPVHPVHPCSVSTSPNPCSSV
jgi:hypothetical protein